MTTTTGHGPTFTIRSSAGHRVLFITILCALMGGAFVADVARGPGRGATPVAELRS